MSKHLLPLLLCSCTLFSYKAFSYTAASESVEDKLLHDIAQDVIVKYGRLVSSYSDALVDKSVCPEKKKILKQVADSFAAASQRSSQWLPFIGKAIDNLVLCIDKSKKTSDSNDKQKTCEEELEEAIKDGHGFEYCFCYKGELSCTRF